MIGYATYWHVSRVNRAVTAERTKWEDRTKAEAAQYAAEMKRLTEEAQAKEKAHASKLAEIGANYAKGLQNAEVIRRRDIASARDGALVLRIPAGACQSGPGTTGEVGPPAPGRNGAKTIELPRQITSDLFTLANDADQVADQLRACQAIIIADRKE